MTEVPSSYRRRFRRPEGRRHPRLLTFSCYRRACLLDQPCDCDLVVAALRKARDRNSVQVHAWVVMPDHVHLLVGPARTGRDALSRFLADAKRHAARRILDRWRAQSSARLSAARVGPTSTHRLWQTGGGHDRFLRTRPVIESTIAYIHANPVRRGLVPRASNWSWSSAPWWGGRADPRPDPFPVEPIGIAVRPPPRRS